MRETMPENRAEYLASGSGPEPEDRARLDLIRSVLSRKETWSEPPPEVADQVIAAISAEKRPADLEPVARSRRWPLVAAVSTGAAAVVIAIMGMLGVFSSPDQQVLAIEGTDLQPSATGEASIRESGAGWWIRLELDDLPAADQGTYYEGWVWNDDGQGVSIGTFHLRGGDQQVILWSGVDPANYPSIWVTLEDEDGNPAASERIVMRGRQPES